DDVSLRVAGNISGVGDGTHIIAATAALEALGNIGTAGARLAVDVSDQFWSRSDELYLYSTGAVLGKLDVGGDNAMCDGCSQDGNSQGCYWCDGGNSQGGDGNSQGDDGQVKNVALIVDILADGSISSGRIRARDITLHAFGDIGYADDYLVYLAKKFAASSEYGTLYVKSAIPPEDNNSQGGNNNPPPTPPPVPAGAIKITKITLGSGQASLDFAIRAANGKGYTIYISETGLAGSFKAYTNVSYTGKGVTIKGLTNNKTYYVYIEYVEGGKVIEQSDVVTVKPSQNSNQQ
ncbi:MAG: hypothetical protein LBH09_03990, partial [Peptococcaceae bacterium]|nr:hypothetical protein [Peptococcaceae bacterium]